MKLTIFNVSMVDYGTYKCVAKNPRGETDGTIRLYGKFKITFYLWNMCKLRCRCLQTLFLVFGKWQNCNNRQKKEKNWEEMKEVERRWWIHQFGRCAFMHKFSCLLFRIKYIFIFCVCVCFWAIISSSCVPSCRTFIALRLNVLYAFVGMTKGIFILLLNWELWLKRKLFFFFFYANKAKKPLYYFDMSEIWLSGFLVFFFFAVFQNVIENI